MRAETADRTPDFVIIGSAKSGTTSLYNDLSNHPHTHLPPTKEPQILNKAKNAEIALRMYAHHFAGATTDQVVGEASTYYAMHPLYPSVADLASQVLDDSVKLIYIMRNPVERIKSQLAFEYATGRLKHTDFDRAVRDDAKFVDWSDYPMQLKQWFEHFDMSAFMFVSFEAYAANREREAKKVASFVGLSPELLEPNATISNQRGTQLRPRAQWINTLLTREYFRRAVSPKVPQFLHRLARPIVVEQMPNVDVALSDQTLEDITSRLGMVG